MAQVRWRICRMSKPTSSPHSTSAVAPALVAALVLGACSLLPSSRSGGAASRSAASEPPAEQETPLQASQRETRELGAKICARTAEAAGKTWPDETKHSRPARMRHFREIIAAAPRQQFIALTAATSAFYQDASKLHTRKIPAGEPLLLLSCDWKDLTGGRLYTSATLISVDGVLETPLGIPQLHDSPEAAAKYDLEPATFAFDPTTVVGTPRDASASDIYAEGHPDDRAKAPKLAALHTKAGQCALKATGACMAAEQEVEAGPWRADLEVAKDRACTAAVKRERSKCMSAADAKAYDKLIDELWVQSRAREQVYLGGLVEKFS